jgi:hypothetical protein
VYTFGRPSVCLYSNHYIGRYEPEYPLSTVHSVSICSLLTSVFRVDPPTLGIVHWTLDIFDCRCSIHSTRDRSKLSSKSEDTNVPCSVISTFWYGFGSWLTNHYTSTIRTTLLYLLAEQYLSSCIIMPASAPQSVICGNPGTELRSFRVGWLSFCKIAATSLLD